MLHVSETWQAAYDDMQALKLLDNTFDLNQAFDTHFVEAYYASKKE